jgi:hypothetical protein
VSLVVALAFATQVALASGSASRSADASNALLIAYSLEPVSINRPGTVKSVWLKLNTPASRARVSVRLENRLGPLPSVAGHCAAGVRTQTTSVFLCRFAAPVDVEFVDRLEITVFSKRGASRTASIEPRER